MWGREEGGRESGLNDSFQVTSASPAQLQAMRQKSVRQRWKRAGEEVILAPVDGEEREEEYGQERGVGRRRRLRRRRRRLREEKENEEEEEERGRREKESLASTDEEDEGEQEVGQDHDYREYRARMSESALEWSANAGGVLTPGAVVEAAILKYGH